MHSWLQHGVLTCTQMHGLVCLGSDLASPLDKLRFVLVADPSLQQPGSSSHSADAGRLPRRRRLVHPPRRPYGPLRLKCAAALRSCCRAWRWRWRWCLRAVSGHYRRNHCPDLLHGSCSCLLLHALFWLTTLGAYCLQQNPDKHPKHPPLIVALILQPAGRCCSWPPASGRR